MNATALHHELVFSTSRSSGPGGQNVNKVNTKVTLKFDVAGSAVLSEDEKQVIAEKLATRITTEGILVLVSQDKRSQLTSLLRKHLKRRKSVGRPSLPKLR
jgi:ribosome-associated protein